MDRARALLEIFYSSGAVADDDRRRAHLELLSLLRQSQTYQEAARFIEKATATPTLNSALDSALVFYACTSLEDLANSGNCSLETLRVHFALLVDFMVAAYKGNQLPRHVVLKAARAAVAFGRREWAFSGNRDAQFPRLVLQLIGQDAAAPGLIAGMFAGTSLLSVLVDGLQDARSGLLAVESRALISNLGHVADDMLAALEVALRIKGMPPGLSDGVPLAAARSVANIVRVHPKSASNAAALLRRCVSVRVDGVSSEIMGVLADLYTEANFRLNQQDCNDALLHVSTYLECVAMGECAVGMDEASVLFRVRLVAYAEAVARRIIAHDVQLLALERLFNGLMGTCIRWADNNPESFPVAIDTWLSIFDDLLDSGINTSAPLVGNVLRTLSELCVHKCRFVTNQHLDALADDTEDSLHDYGAEVRQASVDSNISTATMKAILGWDHTAELVENIGVDSAGISTALLALSVRGAEPNEADGDEEELGIASRKQYVNKCVEAIVMCSQFNIEEIGHRVMKLVVETLNSKSLVGADEKHASDIVTVTNIAYSLCQIVPKDSPSFFALLDAVIKQLRSAVQGVQGAVSTEAVFGLLRLGALLVRMLMVKPGEQIDAAKKNGAIALAEVAVTFLEMDTYPKISSAATFLILALVQSFGTLIFVSELPYAPAFAPRNRHVCTVSTLMATAVVEWLLVKRSRRAAKWNDEEKVARTNKFGGACELMLGDFVQVCRDLKSGLSGGRLVEVARGATILRTIVGVMHEASVEGKEMLWVGAVRELTKCCLEAMLAFKALYTNVSGTERECLFAAMTCLVGSVRAICSVCRRHVRREMRELNARTFELCVELAQGDGTSRLAGACLKMLRDHVYMLDYNIDRDEIIRDIEISVVMSVRALADDGDSDLSCTAVSLLGDIINRHWLLLWPEDAVKNPNVSVQQSTTNSGGVEGARNIYFRALEAIVNALCHKDPSVSRSAILTLESLNASRKLYKRDPSFRACGAAQKTLLGAFEILGASGDDGRRSLEDEVVSLVWGIAAVDLQQFYASMLPEMLRNLVGNNSDAAARIAESFSGVSDRPSFVKALHAATNDIALNLARSRAPVL